jgi:hypothetical protein
MYCYPHPSHTSKATTYLLFSEQVENSYESILNKEISDME